jgi:hypothetical protein
MESNARGVSAGGISSLGVHREIAQRSFRQKIEQLNTANSVSTQVNSSKSPAEYCDKVCRHDLAAEDPKPSGTNPFDLKPSPESPHIGFWPASQIGQIPILR